MRTTIRYTHPVALALKILACCAFLPALAPDPAAGAEEWVPLFNGKNLDGWRPKITGHELGDNYRDTFRVTNGLLRVSYDGYESFGGKFGHVFYEKPFSHYILRIEYRFVGDQAKDGPGWAFRNSGVMVHAQPPETMNKDQKFPVSIEAQMLGGSGTGERSTANLCTPGTHVVVDGKLVTQHCTSSTSKTFHGDQWVTMEVEVHGNGTITHRVNGESVLAYEQPQLDESDPDAKQRIKDLGGIMLSEGHFALQAESHPVEFRKVEIKELQP